MIKFLLIVIGGILVVEFTKFLLQIDEHKKIEKDSKEEK